MLAKDNSFIIVASCPNTHFATARQAIQGNRNCIEAWGRIDDLSGMTAALFGNNVDLEMRKIEVEGPEQLAEEMAKVFVCDACPDEPFVMRW
eukprot:COSAG02_NODE_59256_length_275_cov_0.323864_1_plen_91_part_11